MKIVTMYEAVDGTQFRTAAEAERRDALISEIALALAPLGVRRPSAYEFIRHDAKVLRGVKGALLAIARRELPGFPDVWRHPDDEIAPLGIAGRIINDAGPAPLDRAWYRLCCIDDEGREWEQPYFVAHPPKPGDYTELAAHAH